MFIRLAMVVARSGVDTAICSKPRRLVGTQHLPLLRNGVAPALKELVLVSVKDIGHFEPMSTYAVLFPPCAVWMSRIGRSSSGLALACSLASETCR
jgi:hypothetical protein